jgi:outer membrane protein OmpA-like peptidoglycan-associated protein
MRKLLLILGISASSVAFSQGGTFTLVDTVFHQGAVLVDYSIWYSQPGGARIRSESYPHLDSLAEVMKKHPEIVWEIGCYLDQRGGDSINAKITRLRASAIRNYLVRAGVPETQIVAVGYGEMRPIHNQKAINAAQSNDERERMYGENRRTEIKILSVQ